MNVFGSRQLFKGALYTCLTTLIAKGPNHWVQDSPRSGREIRTFIK